MKKATVFLATGFEEVEALTTIDVLRRAGCEVTLVAVGVPKLEVASTHQVRFLADVNEKTWTLGDTDLIVFPGGMPGATNLAASQTCLEAARTMIESGRHVAAICAAPMVLQAAGILKDNQYTCYPGCEKRIGGNYQKADGVVSCNHLITAPGPGYSMEFALFLAELLTGKEMADQLRKGMLVH